MHYLLKFIKGFFLTLGVIFFILIVLISYFWIKDPFEIKSSLPPDTSASKTIQIITGTSEVTIDNVDKNPLLNETQEAQLESFGIDPATVPSAISPEMETCFRTKLSDERVQQILDGDSPTTQDFFKARTCIEYN